MERQAASATMTRPYPAIGAKGIGQSATVDSPTAVVNAFAPFGVRNADMPLTPAAVSVRDPASLP